MHLAVHGLMHATILAIVGYFILLSSTKASGLVSALGKILALWVFLLAVLALLCSLFGPMMGGKSMDMMRGGPSAWMHGWGSKPEATPAPGAAPTVSPAPDTSTPAPTTTNPTPKG